MAFQPHPEVRAHPFCDIDLVDATAEGRSPDAATLMAESGAFRAYRFTVRSIQATVLQFMHREGGGLKPALRCCGI